MTDKDWIKILNSNTDPVTIVLAYCLYKGKPKELSEQFVQLVSFDMLIGYGITINNLAEEAITNICIELGLIELSNKQGKIIAYYKNNSQNGKEILKI